MCLLSRPDSGVEKLWPYSNIFISRPWISLVTGKSGPLLHRLTCIRRENELRNSEAAQGAAGGARKSEATSVPAFNKCKHLS